MPVGLHSYLYRKMFLLGRLHLKIRMMGDISIAILKTYY